MKQAASRVASFMLFYCFVYYSTLKMEATYSSETSVDLQWTTRRYIREDRTILLNISRLTLREKKIVIYILCGLKFM
jgi:hypothetical protein